MSPLELAIPVGGIALIVLVVWLLGGMRTASLGDEAAARARIALDHPEIAIADLVMARDRLSALGFAGDGAGLVAVVAVGDRAAVRVLRPPEVRNARLRGADLALTLTDLGAPRLVFRLTDGAAAHAALERVERWRAQAGRLAA